MAGVLSAEESARDGPGGRRVAKVSKSRVVGSFPGK